MSGPKMTVQLVETVIEVAHRSASEIATARKRVEMHLPQLRLAAQLG
ncbi:hypothetical protein amrb99_16070 [Actinomadura sp. RB99]|nr:hypothetical protein [Actinomadura sp. RB99]